MIKEATATGSSVDEALANAKAILGAPYDAEIHTQVLEMPKKKVLGIFGGAPAKVKVWYDAPEPKVHKEKAPKPEKTAAQKPQAAEKQPAKAPVQKKAQVQEKKEAAAKIQTEEPVKAAEESVALKKVDLSSNAALTAAADYLKMIVLGMGCEKAEVEAFETAESEIVLELDCGEDYGIIIGRRGETLDAIQYLTRLAANKLKSETDYSRVSINVGNYRERRKQTLAELAKKNAAKVLKYGRNFVFEPMNPYERRIIHTTVQEIEGVTSHSVGSDNERKVVITLAEGVKPTHPSKGGYNNRGKGGRRPNNNRRPANNNRNTSSDAPKRAPKTDAGAQGISLYGKIN